MLKLNQTLQLSTPAPLLNRKKVKHLGLADNQRILDPRKGPIKKQALVNLPKLTSSADRSYSKKHSKKMKSKDTASADSGSADGGTLKSPEKTMSKSNLMIDGDREMQVSDTIENVDPKSKESVGNGISSTGGDSGVDICDVNENVVAAVDVDGETNGYVHDSSSFFVNDFT